MRFSAHTFKRKVLTLSILLGPGLSAPRVFTSSGEVMLSFYPHAPDFYQAI